MSGWKLPNKNTSHFVKHITLFPRPDFVPFECLRQYFLHILRDYARTGLLKKKRESILLLLLVTIYMYSVTTIDSSLKSDNNEQSISNYQGNPTTLCVNYILDYIERLFQHRLLIPTGF